MPAAPRTGLQQPPRRPRRPTPPLQRTVIKSAALAGLSATLLSAGSAQAAVEVANIAAGDNRFGTLTLLAVPALGWGGRELGGLCAAGRRCCTRAPPGVLLPPLTLSPNPPFSRAFLSGLQHLRPGKSLHLLPHALARRCRRRRSWFRMRAHPTVPHPPRLPQLQNQLAAMDEKNAGVKRGVAAGLGLTAASLLAAQQAEAAAEVMQVAASDNRFGTLALLAVPALGVSKGPAQRARWGAPVQRAPACRHCRMCGLQACAATDTLPPLLLPLHSGSCSTFWARYVPAFAALLPACNAPPLPPPPRVPAFAAHPCTPCCPACLPRSSRTSWLPWTRRTPAPPRSAALLPAWA